MEKGEYQSAITRVKERLGFIRGVALCDNREEVRDALLIALREISETLEAILEESDRRLECANFWFSCACEESTEEDEGA